MNEIKENLPKETPVMGFESDIESYQHQFSKLQKRVQSHAASVELLQSTQALLEQVIAHQSLGDFDALIADLKELESTNLDALKSNLKVREEICSEAESSVEPEQLPKLRETIDSLLSKWSKAGDVSPADQKMIENRFQKAIHKLNDLQRDYYNSILEDNLKLKTKLCEKAEKISQSNDWKNSGDKLVNLEKKWKKIGAVPHDQKDVIWERFQDALNAYYQRRNEYFSEFEQKKRQNLILKEKFCEEAEIVSESEDWYDAEDKLTQLEEDWKVVGPVPNDQKDIIWDRFQNAVNHFYARRTQYFEERQEELAANLAEKVGLCERAEALKNTDNWKVADEEINKLQSEWKIIGHVPLNEKDEIWKRFRKAIVAFYEARKLFFKQREEEWKKLMQMKEKVCIEAEAICESDNIKETESRIKELQAEWKNIGYVPHDMSSELWERFQSAANRFFERRNEQFEHQKIENLARKEGLCRQAEALADSTDWSETAEKFKALQKEWKEIGIVPPGKSNVIWKRFRKAADSFFNNRKAYYDENDPGWQERLSQKEDLCRKAENLRYSHKFNTVEEQFKELVKAWESISPLPMEINDAVENRFQSSVGIFQKRLKTYQEEKEKGFYDNLKLKEQLCEQAEAIPLTGNLKASVESAKLLQEKWKQIGPVPWKENKAIWNRFREAVNRVFRVSRAEHKAKYLDWKKNLKHTVSIREEQLEKLRASIDRDEKNLKWVNRSDRSNQAEWKQKLMEIAHSDRKDEITERLNSKRERLSKLEKSIADMKKKLE